MKQAVLTPNHSFGAVPNHAGWARWRWQLVGLLLPALLLLGSPAQAAPPIVYTVGTSGGGAFPTIAAALAAVPSPMLQAYELQLIDAAYTEDILLDKTGSASNTLTLRPAPGLSPVLTGTLTFGAGCSYAVLSGNDGTLTRALTLRQPSQTAPAVVFSGDATHNEVREAIVLGSNTLLTSGVVLVGDGVSTGNDYNAVAQCFVGNADPAQLPANLVYAANAGGGLNDNFSLTNNQLFNFERTGVLVATGNGDQWTISGNSLYYNAAAMPTTAQTGIDFHPGLGANDAMVANNFIGGRAVGATGGTWTNAGTQNFKGIVMSCGTSTSLTNEVTSNVVNAVQLTSLTGQVVTALGVDAGRAELSSNAVTNVFNVGTSGVNSLVSKATTILSSFSVSNGQVMVVSSGLTVVLGNLSNAGILNHTGGDMLINGNFTNTVGAAFAQTAGDIEIKGDMLNSGLFTCTTGTVRLSGNGPQKVSGGTYFNLEVTGPGTKTLTKDADVYNGVKMVTGVLNTGTHRITLEVTASLTETDASYVLGEIDVERDLVAGVAEDFGGVGLRMQPALASTLPGDTYIKRFTGVAPVSVGGRQGILRYFDISAPTNAGLDLTMTMSYFDHELNAITPANLRFFKSENSGASWQLKGRSSVGSAGPGTGYVVLNNVSGFSRWTLGDITNPLPVGLTAFRAERQGRHALLTWATATERDNRGFGIEVSLDGKTFREIGFVAAEGSTSSTARSYRFMDAADTKAGRRYYRLRQDDGSGAAHYFGPRQLNFEAEPATLAAYPTQFGPELTVALTSPAATAATLRLLDGMGREVWHQAVASGAAPLRVQPACAPGSYILTATLADGQVLRQRVVKD